MLPNQLEKVAQIAANGVSEVLDLKNFRGGMPPDPPNNAITIINLQRSDFPLDPPLYFGPWHGRATNSCCTMGSFP